MVFRINYLINQKLLLYMSSNFFTVTFLTYHEHCLLRNNNTMIICGAAIWSNPTCNMQFCRF